MNSGILAPKLGGYSLALWDGVIYRAGMGGPGELPQGGPGEAQIRRDEGLHSTEMWPRRHVVLMAPCAHRLGTKRQAQMPRPFQGLLSTVGSFPKGPMNPGQQKGTSLHRPGKGPVSFSTCLLSLYLVSGEHLPLCCMVWAGRHSPCSQHQGQTCTEHTERARP